MIDGALIDSHVHLWDPETFPMPWLEDAPSLRQAYDVYAYERHVKGLPIGGFVYVEVGVAPQFALLEARRAVELGGRDARLHGIIAAAPLEFGAGVRTYLDELRALGPLIKGVRRNLQDEADASYCLQPDFLRGIHLLADFGFSFDICIRSHQMPSVIEMARRCPEVRFVLDHLGKPAIERHELDPWREHLRQLAECPNVWCKLSGLVTEAQRNSWQPAQLKNYVDCALSVFGSSRLMFGSDWPVLLQSSTYARWAETLDALIADVPQRGQREIWSDTARRCYRLEAGS